MLRQTLLLLPLAFVGLSHLAAAAEPKAGNFAAESIKVGGDAREYRLVVPKSVDLAKPAPLVVAFHGMLIDSKDVMPLYTKLNETAEKHGFILAYPDAIGRSWGMAADKVKNDLAFFDALLEQAAGRLQARRRPDLRPGHVERRLLRPPRRQRVLEDGGGGRFAFRPAGVADAAGCASRAEVPRADRPRRQGPAALRSTSPARTATNTSGRGTR